MRLRSAMQRILGIRIVSWWAKLAYVVGAWLIGFPLLALLDVLRAPELVISLANNGVTLASILLGARLFRGRGESVAPPRAWWRMTARPLLSRVLGIIAVLYVVSTAIVALTGALGLRSLVSVTVWDSVVTGPVAAYLAYRYLLSAARLARMPVAEPEPRFRPSRKLT